MTKLPLRRIIVKTKYQIFNVNKKIRLHYNYGAEEIRLYFRCIERPNWHANLKMQGLISTAKLSRKAFMICVIFVYLFSPLHCFNGFDFHILHTFLVAIYLSLHFSLWIAILDWKLFPDFTLPICTYIHRKYIIILFIRIYFRNLTLVK